MFNLQTVCSVYWALHIDIARGLGQEVRLNIPSIMSPSQPAIEWFEAQYHYHRTAPRMF